MATTDAMAFPSYTLTVVTTADGFIARATDHAPHNWASAEEQERFFADVDAADWAVMGRHTHEAADRRDRRRIVFSATVSGWERPNQLWLDPGNETPQSLAARVAQIHPLKNGLILGGTAVHDWFLAHDAIDRINLTVEPVTFGAGLPLFTGHGARAPYDVLEQLKFTRTAEEALNASGTLWSSWTRAR